MTPFEYIALANALLGVAANADETVQRIVNALGQNTEMTAEERKGFESLMAKLPDYAKPRS